MSAHWIPRWSSMSTAWHPGPPGRSGVAALLPQEALELGREVLTRGRLALGLTVVTSLELGDVGARLGVVGHRRVQPLLPPVHLGGERAVRGRHPGDVLEVAEKGHRRLGVVI